MQKKEHRFLDHQDIIQHTGLSLESAPFHSHMGE